MTAWEAAASAPPPLGAFTAVNPRTGVRLVLHSVLLRAFNGRVRRSYFFVREGKRPKRGEPCDLPIGYEVTRRQANGHPFVRRARG